MKDKPIIIVPGEIHTIFYEILFKSLKRKKFKSPLIIVTSKKIFIKKMKKFSYKKKIESISDIKNQKSFRNDRIYIINIDHKINDYLSRCFKETFKVLKLKITNKFINGPINKSKFLNKKFLGITEYISKNFKIKKNAMLIFNRELSICPVTTHLPLKLVPKKINQKLIVEKILLVNNFYKSQLGIKPNIAITGINPHCESVLKINEDVKIVTPAIKHAKKKNVKVSGPYSADTIFQKKNRKKFDVIIGMYHDQVLTAFKTIYEFDAINITLGLPFFRVSPDHGPNEKMVNMNLSNPLSLIRALEFLDNK
tara:strand:- start:939 stop:1868 length:930 start_codon:yes stop_codon:yes gene_type:complete